MIEYTTKKGDMLDAICYEYYKSTDYMEQVLAYNRGLAAYPAVLPAGVIIQLPEIKKPAKKRKVSLW